MLAVYCSLIFFSEWSWGKTYISAEIWKLRGRDWQLFCSQDLVSRTCFLPSPSQTCLKYRNMKKNPIVGCICLLTTCPTEWLKISPGTNLKQRAAMPPPVSRISVIAVHVPKPRATSGDELHLTLTCSACINGVKRGQRLSAVLSAALLRLLAPKEEGWASRACNGLPNPWLLLFPSYVHLLRTSPVSSSSTSGPQKLTTVISYLAGSSVAGI